MRSLTWVVVVGAAGAALLAFTGSDLVPALRDRAADAIQDRVTSGDQGAAQLSPAEYLQLQRGATTTQVRELVGEPEERSGETIEGVRLECWYYGVAGATGAFQLCFSGDRLASRFRYDAG